jgi:hypothetical protein
VTILLLVSAYEPLRILSDEHCEIARDIARTIPRTFWIQWRKPSSVGNDRYRLQEIVADLRVSTCKLFKCDDKRCVPTLRCIVTRIDHTPCMEYPEPPHEPPQEKSNDGEEINVMTHPIAAPPSELDEVLFEGSEGDIADPLLIWGPCVPFLAWMRQWCCNSE